MSSEKIINNQQQQNVQDESEIEELLFSGGAGCIGYMMGYLHALISIVGKQNLKKYKLGGVSAGNAAALFFHMTLYQDKYDMKYFHENETCKYFKKENKKYYGLFTNYKVIQQNSMAYADYLEEFEDQIPDVNGLFHSVSTEWTGMLSFKKAIIDKFEDKHDLMSAIEASCQIPILTAPKIFKKHNGRYLMDGGLKGCVPYKYENSKKIFINMLPKYTQTYAELRKKTKNMKSLHITEGYNIQFPRDYYVWGEDFNDNMFLKGYLAARQNQLEILEVFGIKTQDLKKQQQNIQLEHIKVHEHTEEELLTQLKDIMQQRFEIYEQEQKKMEEHHIQDIIEKMQEYAKFHNVEHKYEQLKSQLLF